MEDLNTESETVYQEIYKIDPNCRGDVVYFPQSCCHFQVERSFDPTDCCQIVGPRATCFELHYYIHGSDRVGWVVAVDGFNVQERLGRERVAIAQSRMHALQIQDRERQIRALDQVTQFSKSSLNFFNGGRWSFFFTSATKTEKRVQLAVQQQNSKYVDKEKVQYHNPQQPSHLVSNEGDVFSWQIQMSL